MCRGGSLQGFVGGSVMGLLTAQLTQLFYFISSDRIFVKSPAYFPKFCLRENNFAPELLLTLLAGIKRAHSRGYCLVFGVSRKPTCQYMEEGTDSP